MMENEREEQERQLNVRGGAIRKLREKNKELKIQRNVLAGTLVFAIILLACMTVSMNRWASRYQSLESRYEQFIEGITANNEK